MVQRAKVQHERRGGLTLFELLIVIVVLGILAGIVVFGLRTFKQDATAAACRADDKQVQTAIDAFLARPGAPATVAASSGPTVAADYDFLTTAVAPAKPLLNSSPATVAAHVWGTDGNVASTC